MKTGVRKKQQMSSKSNLHPRRFKHWVQA